MALDHPFKQIIVQLDPAEALAAVQGLGQIQLCIRDLPDNHCTLPLHSFLCPIVAQGGTDAKGHPMKEPAAAPEQKGQTVRIHASIDRPRWTNLYEM